MSARRKSERRANTALDDAGLFKTGVVEIEIRLTPLRKKTSRGDLMFVGFMNETEVDVIFPGRRAAQTGPLLEVLDTLLRKANQAALNNNRPLPAIYGLQFPLRCQGYWRVSIKEDDAMLDRRFQFLVARWTITAPDGALHVFGDTSEMSADP